MATVKFDNATRIYPGNDKPSVDKLNIEFAGFDQRSDSRCGNPEVRRRVLKRSTRRFPSVLVVDFD